MPAKIKILFLAANPVDATYRPRLDEEAREIEDKIQRGSGKDSFEFITRWSVRTSDLQRLLMDHCPHIVHFSGHGDKKQGIILEDNEGNMKAVSKEALIALFATLKDNIRVVFLNACHSKRQIKTLSETIDFVIVMNTTIGDKAAVIFSSYFYQSLAFKRSVKEAFQLAINQLLLEGIDETKTPELLVREGVDASQTYLIPHEVSAQDRQRVAFLPLALLSGFMIAGFVTEVAARFETEWQDTIIKLSNLALVINSALFIIAVILLVLATKSRPLLEKGVQAGILKAYKFGNGIIVLVALLCIALGLRLSFPYLAHFYNERGFQSQEAGELSQARKSYQLALSLKPDYAQAHYNLATTYEELDSEKAIEEYKTAIKNDNKLYHAYNNLARLYLKQGKDKEYESALEILNKAMSLSPSDDGVRYTLYKNLGWANYALKNYLQAEAYLKSAISLRGEEGAAAAHCLLAYVLKEQGKPGVDDQCEDCVRFAPGEVDVEQKWVDDAKEQLMKETD